MYFLFSSSYVLKCIISVKMCIFHSQLDSSFCTLFLVFILILPPRFKTYVNPYCKKTCLTALNWGIFFFKTCFLQMRILAHNSFIYYISKMFYCTLNVCRVFRKLTLIVYTSNCYKILHSFTRKLSLCHLSFFE